MNERWCAHVSPDGCVLWPEFNTRRWDNTGDTYAMQPLLLVAAGQASLSDGIDVAVTPISDSMCIRQISLM